jgi:hypothetical protein
MSDVDALVSAFINGVSGATRRRDADTLLELMGRITGAPARMWGPSLIGFGQYHYKYASGREGDAPAAGFSPRKAATSIYLPDGVGPHEEALDRLGEHTVGVGCLYVKDLTTVDLRTLEGIIDASFSTVTAGVFGHRALRSQKEADKRS